jgi:hypothetical protein
MLSHPGRYGSTHPQRADGTGQARCALCRRPVKGAPVVNDDLSVCCSTECAAALRAPAFARTASGSGRHIP